MASPLSGIREELGRMAQAKRDRYKDPLDQAMKYAQLAESGYQVTPGKSGFMGFGSSPTTVTRDPDYVGMNALKKRKLQAETGLAESQAGLFDQYASKFGQNSSNGGDNLQAIDDEIAKLKEMLNQGKGTAQNKTVVPPTEKINPLDPLGIMG